MAFALPVNLILPAQAAKVPAIDMSPEMVIELVVVTEPLTASVLSEIPSPLIVFAVPLNVMVPLECVKVPAPVVARFPETFIDEELATIYDAAIIKL